MAILPFALAAGGALAGLLGGKGKGPQQIDPEMAAYINFLRQFSQHQMSPLLQQMMAALGGDEGALRQIAGPSRAFMQPVFARQREQAYRRAGDLATQSGAYGGSRQGVAEALGIRDVNEQEAQFEYQGQQDALMRALQLMGLGPAYFQQGAVPTGQIIPGQERNPLLGALGGALSGFSLGSGGFGGGAGGAGAASFLPNAGRLTQPSFPTFGGGGYRPPNIWGNDLTGPAAAGWEWRR